MSAPRWSPEANPDLVIPGVLALGSTTMLSAPWNPEGALSLTEDPGLKGAATTEGHRDSVGGREGGAGQGFALRQTRPWGSSSTLLSQRG